MWVFYSSDGWAGARQASQKQLKVQAQGSKVRSSLMIKTLAATVFLLTPAEIRSECADCRQPGADNLDPVRKLSKARSWIAN